MAALPEDPTWEPEIYQLEDTDPVSGGAPNIAIGDGMDNVPHQQLAKRTSWLKAQVDGLLGSVVAATTLVAGIVQLSTATNSTSTTLAATPSAVKAAFDNAESRVTNARTVTGSGLATGGGALVSDQVINVAIATQAEAEAGALNTKAMTPLRVAQAIAAAFGSAVTIVGNLTATRLRLTSTTDVSLASTNHAFQVGDDAGVNLAMDNNEIIARNNGTAATLGLNMDGGNVTLGNATSTVTIAGTVAGGVMATQAEAEAGAANDKLMTPLRVAQAIAAWGYTSALQTITGNTVLTLAHGLGARPTRLELVARCTTAQAPYAVGDEVQMAAYVTAGVSYGVSVAADATNIKIRTADLERLYLHDNAGSYNILTPASWRWVVRAGL